MSRTIVYSCNGVPGSDRSVLSRASVYECNGAPLVLALFRNFRKLSKCVPRDRSAMFVHASGLASEIPALILYRLHTIYVCAASEIPTLFSNF